MTTVSSHLRSQVLAIQLHPFTHEGRETDLISEIARIPRSGKYYRFRKYGVDLPSRSIYDHIHSLAYNADLLIDTLGIVVDREKLANMFVFHDLDEVFVGDVPYFSTECILGAPHFTPEEKEEKELAAYEKILAIFDGKLREEYGEYVAIKKAKKSSEFLRIMNFFDRTDAIINVWRYIDRFRDKINIDQYLTMMNDFFINPYLISYSIDNETSDFILFLGCSANARKFFHEGYGVFEDFKSPVFTPDIMTRLMKSPEFHLVG